MKNRNLIVALAAFMLSVSSCSDFLDQEPQTALTEEEIFSDLNNVEPLIVGLYTKWRDLYRDRYAFIFSLGTDESRQGDYQVATQAEQAGFDRYNAFLAPGNSAVGKMWDDRWPIVSAAATAIASLQSSNTDADRRRELLGEASFLRAVVTFELAQYWGEVPIIDLDSLDTYGASRRPLASVYGLIVRDLQRAIECLPTTQTDLRRATKGAAQALLGKAYLYAPQESGYRDYEKAKKQFEDVIGSGKYSLEANFADLWNPYKPNPGESIYSFQFNNVSPDFNIYQWQMGSRALAQFDAYCYFGGYDLMMPTPYCYNTVDEGGVWEDGDLRKEESIRYDFHYKGQVPSPVLTNDELDPHVKKFEDIRGDGVFSFYYSGKNAYYLRYADILLCYAETLNETGNTSQAVTEVNNIRARAWGGTLPVDKQWDTGMSAEQFRINIMDERMRELCFEGWRRRDLIRTGKLVELVKVRNKWAAESNTIKEFHNRYPIPRQEILQNDDIDEDDQNPGYTNQ